LEDKAGEGMVLQTVSNALKIFELFGKTKKELGVTEISKQLGLHKSIIFRLIKTLEARGWIKQNENRKYFLSFRAYEIGSVVLENAGLGSNIQPFIGELAREVGESVHIGVLDGREIIYIYKVTPSNELRVEVRIGVRMPAHCTAMGKVILAYSPPKVIEECLYGKERLESSTPFSITEQANFYSSLQQIKEQGFSWSFQELFHGIMCIAAPIFDMAGNVIAAVSIAQQYRELSADRKRYLEEEVTIYGKKISRSFGWLP
jgi:DNA-binding IclR family transcriptional regulator